MAIKPIPHPTVPLGELLDQNGRVIGRLMIAKEWYEFLQTTAVPFTLRTHTHDGVTVGGGVSGPPVPGT